MNHKIFAVILLALSGGSLAATAELQKHAAEAAKTAPPKAGSTQTTPTTLAAIPPRNQWLRVTVIKNAGDSIGKAYQQQLIAKITADASWEIAYLSESATVIDPPEKQIKKIENERDKRIKHIQSESRISTTLTFDSRDGTNWEFFRDNPNSPPTRLRKVTIQPLTNYLMDIQILCSVNDDACKNMADSAGQTKPIPPIYSMVNKDQYWQWLRIARAEPCDPDKPINMAPPKYPAYELRNGVGGTVTLRIAYNSCGDMLDVKISRSSGSRGLDRSALETARKWRVNVNNLSVQDQTGLADVPISFTPDP
ncbi:MAG: energy transducer TonB [Arenimonas sp.]